MTEETTEPTGTRKGIVKVNQVTSIEVDLDKYVGNVFPINGRNQTVTSLEDLAAIVQNDNKVDLGLIGTTTCDVIDAQVIDPVVMDKVEKLRKQAQKTLDEANKLIKG